MYIRLISNQKTVYENRDQFPLSMAIVREMNKAGADQPFFGQPEKIDDIKYADIGAYGSLGLPAGLWHKWTKLHSPGDTYGAYEHYAEAAIVFIETDNHYTYIVAKSQRAQAAMIQAADQLGISMAVAE